MFADREKSILLKHFGNRHRVSEVFWGRKTKRPQNKSAIHLPGNISECLLYAPHISEFAGVIFLPIDLHFGLSSELMPPIKSFDEGLWIFMKEECNATQCEGI
jgi:hypothetical protein